MIRVSAKIVHKGQFNVQSRKTFSNYKVAYNKNPSLSSWMMIKYHLGIMKMRFPIEKIKMSGENLYAIAAEYPDFQYYIESFEVPNTYQSWFSFMGLHAWLILLRLRSEGVEGSLAKTKFFETLYKDIDSRTKGFNVTNKKKVIGYLQSQLGGFMVGLDEGLLSNQDCVLAGTIWRDMFSKFTVESDQDFVRLERMVDYVLKQIQHLNSLSSEDLLLHGRITFLPFDGDKLNKTYTRDRLEYCLTRPDTVKYI